MIHSIDRLREVKVNYYLLGITIKILIDIVEAY